jgi:hypothetical protein
MKQFINRLYRVSVFLLLLLFAITYNGCGGSGGGTSGIPPSNQSTPSGTVNSFSAALKTNDEIAATSIFAEGTKEKSLRIWRSLSTSEKTFIARAIEDSVTVPSVSDSETRLDLFVQVKDASGVIERIPLVLIRDSNGNWKIRTW